MLQAATIDGNLRAAVWRRARGRAGFTLVEALVALSMFIIVLIAVLGTAEFASRDASNEAERNVALTEVTTGVARIVADLRSAYKVNYPIPSETGSHESSKLDVLVRIPGTAAPQRVFYNCAYNEASGSYDECVRYQSAASIAFTAGQPPAGVTPLVIVPRVLNETTADATSPDPVFKNLQTPSGVGAQPTSGEIVIHTPGRGQLSTSNFKHQVEIRDSFYLRNLDFGQT